jgi:hypothetical protein
MVAILFSLPGLTQTQTAQLNGTITDPAGAVAPMASVTITHLSAGVLRTILSNETGNYVFTNLLPGLYSVAVSKEGFRKAISQPISLDVNQTAMLKVQLQVGAVSESVQVTGQATLLEATTAQLGTVITQEKIADLPLNGRNFSQLLILTAGATPVSVAQNSGGAQVQRVGTFVFPSINGQSNRSNSYTLDGVYNNGHYMGTYAIAPSVDALTQFKVQSHSDQAEFGGVSGGVVNIASKSGANAFHGGLYEFLRNDALDARGFFTSAKPPLRQNQFGGSLGGRIVKDKTFFFFSYEGYRQLNPSSALYLVPTPQELGGNFSASGRRIFDPYSTRPDPADTRRFLRDPFPNNIIPASKLNAATKAWADAVIPKPIDTGFPGFNGRNTSSQTAPSDQYNIRVDHHFSSSDFLWARYTWGQENLPADAARHPPLSTKTNTDSIEWLVSSEVNLYLRKLCHVPLLSSNPLRTFSSGLRRYVSSITSLSSFQIVIVPAAKIPFFLGGLDGWTANF